MAQAAVIVSIVAFLVAWSWFLYGKSARRAWSPLWMAFSTTTAALLFIVTGAAGYRLGRHPAFTAGSAWSDTVLWPQIWAGAVFALAAVFLWRAGLGSLRT